jgi:hypothetical protein
MVWVHGGSNLNGAGSQPEFDGSHLASKGVVVVTINYRLDVFGFLAHPELTKESGTNSSGNYVQVQAVLVHSFIERVKIAESAALDAARTPFRDAANAIPWLHGLRGLPAQLPHRRSGIWNDLEDPDS